MIEVNPDFQTRHARFGCVTSQTASWAFGSTRQTWAEPGRPGNPTSWPTYAQPPRMAMLVGTASAGSLGGRVGSPTLSVLTSRRVEARHRPGAAVPLDPDHVVAGCVGKEHIVRSEGREAERFVLADPRLGCCRDRVGGLVRRYVMDRQDRPVGGLAIEDVIGSDGPGSPVRRDHGINDADRIEEGHSRALLRSLEEVLERRTGRPVCARSIATDVREPTTSAFGEFRPLSSYLTLPPRSSLPAATGPAVLRIVAPMIRLAEARLPTRRSLTAVPPLPPGGPGKCRRNPTSE